ncbi:MAG: CHASE2 domain-containing protein [Bryobacteraceae bacterium]
MRRTGVSGGTVAWALAIALVAASCGVLLDWRAPGLGRYARDWLLSLRGPLRPPNDIALVAIDEKSIQRYGRFPWSRQVIARAIDALAAAQPKAIALDILFTDPTDPQDDEVLARSIGRAGNVAVAAQLIESPVSGGPALWLMPLPAIARAAAGVGHVNVQTEADGVPRQIEVRAADDRGQALLSLAVEAVRIGDGTPETAVTASAHALLLGPRTIPVETRPPPVVLTAAAGTPRMLRDGRMTIDFIGPTGSFGSSTYSLADVLGGSVSPGRFLGKYVLVGATAASMGDRMTSPFVHRSDARGDQHGALMPGVEVLANAVNTILSGRYYSDLPEWAAFFWSALIALATLVALESAQGGPEFLKQLAVLAAIALLLVLVSFLLFTWFLIAPPLVPGLVSVASAGILTLLHRSLAASARLDWTIRELSASDELLAPGPRPPAFGTSGASLGLPHGLEWKVRALGELNARMLDRARFVDFALRSVEDGLLIAAPDGRITFANRAAAGILGTAPGNLTGQNLIRRLLDAPDPELLHRLVMERSKIEREITIRGVRPRHYMLRMAAVSGDAQPQAPMSRDAQPQAPMSGDAQPQAPMSGDAQPQATLSRDAQPQAPVLGIVASLSDVTRQHELQQTKNDVVSLVSHEMRTPLTAIQGMTELLADYELDPAQRRQMHLAINDEVKRLARMITQYLDITRLESGATVLRVSPVRIEALVERLLLLLEPVAAQRGIRLAKRFAPNLPPLVADADLLSRAIENLVSNAIKYSPSGTEVTIQVSAGEEALTVEVTDHGYGIPEADLARIFEKFYRVPRVQDAGTPGTGLGLALVREIAGLHGGSVSVKSEVNAGSTFTLRIPRAETL